MTSWDVDWDMSDVYVMSTNKIDMVLDKGSCAKCKIRTSNLLLVIWQIYYPTKLEKYKICCMNQKKFVDHFNVFSFCLLLTSSELLLF